MMQLGDWIEFDTIVVKERTATGSQPATMALGRTRRGVVVGERQVYDVTDGVPPSLSSPRPVLLVAVSMHRRYRVFPADARPVAAPATSAHQNGSQAASAVATIKLNTNGGAGMGLATITQSDLEVLIADEINRRLASKAWFTAYDITLALRASSPALKIIHDEVRQAVHAQMSAVVGSGLYSSETAMFATGSAMRYVPN